MIIEFSPDFPQQFRKEVRRFLNEWKNVYFRVVDEVKIGIPSTTDGSGAAQIEVLTPYSRSIVELAQPWFALSEEDRTRYLHHEFSHHLTGPCWDCQMSLAKKANNGEAGWLIEEFARPALERTTEDVSRAIQAAYEKGLNDA